jgi:hypothetical protein
MNIEMYLIGLNKDLDSFLKDVSDHLSMPMHLSKEYIWNMQRKLEVFSKEIGVELKNE